MISSFSSQLIGYCIMVVGFSCMILVRCRFLCFQYFRYTPCIVTCALCARASLCHMRVRKPCLATL